MDGSSQGIFGKGWALLGLAAVPGSEKSVDEALRQQAMAALNGFIYFAPVVPHKMSFLGRVMEATNTYFNGTLETPSEVSPYAANLYDAIVLYATTLARINPSINALDGDFVAAMKETRFDGMSGMVTLDEYGDMQESIAAMNYVLQDGKMVSVELGVYDPVLGREYRAAVKPVWPGNTTQVPMDYVSGALCWIITCFRWHSLGPTRVLSMPCADEPFHFALLMPFSGAWDTGSRIAGAAALAVQVVNAD